MRACLIIGVATAVIFCGTYAKGASCELVNGSFEDDGALANLANTEPNGWTASIDTAKFSAAVVNYLDWSSDGNFSVKLQSLLGKHYVAGDVVGVSQQLDLSAAEKISFDLKLAMRSFPTWDNAEARAVILVDGEVVWDSNELGDDPQGEYAGLEYAVEPSLRTPGLKTVTLGLRVNVDAQIWKQYVAYWDNVSITCYCNGGGLLAGDFNGDCVVDMNDLASLASVYMLEPAVGDVHNLYRADDIPGEGGMVNFYDLAALAAGWDGAMAPVEDISANWLSDVAIDSPANLYTGNDVQPVANINFYDYALMLQNWLDSSLVEESQDPVQ